MDDKLVAAPVAPVPARKKGFERFNNGLAYWLNNVFRFIWTIAKFCIKISGVLVFLFPIVILAMCIISPESAIGTLEALMRCVQNIINIFK